MTKKPRPSSKVPQVRAYPMATVRQPPTVANSWPCFAALILTAVALHYHATLLSVLALAAVFFLILGWLYGRWPRTTRLLVRAFINGLFGYRRWVIKVQRRLSAQRRSPRGSGSAATKARRAA